MLWCGWCTRSLNQTLIIIEPTHDVDWDDIATWRMAGIGKRKIIADRQLWVDF